MSGIFDRPQRLQSGDLVVDPARSEAFLEGHRLRLSTMRMRLLYYLMVYHYRVVSHQELFLAMHPGDNPYNGAQALVKKQVSVLRRILGDDASAPRWIITVRGTGYRFGGPILSIGGEP